MQLIGRASQDAREALVDERHAHAAHRPRLGQRRDERSVGDHRHAPHGVGYAQRLRQSQRLAHEQRKRSRALRPRLVFEQAASLRQPAAQRL